MKKRIIFIGIISIAILILGAVYFCYLNNKEMSKEDFLQLMKSFENVPNVKLESSITTKYIKDGYSISIRKDEIYTWANSKTKECISWSPKSKTYSVLDYRNDQTGLENAEYNFIRF